MAGPVRVLHVDDAPQFASMTAEFLERESERIEVETVTDPGDGLELLRDADVDCVVSDYDMPGMDGIEFLERAREDGFEVPFILFTGKGSEEVASEALSKGATDYLQKAAGTDQYALLANRVENAVVQHRTVAQLERQTDVLDEAQAIADLGVCEYDLETGDVWLSKGMYDVFDATWPEPASASPAEYLAEVLEFYHPADRDRVQAVVERAVEAGEPGEVEARPADEERWVRIRCKPTVEDGAVRRVRATVQDVTERRERERERRRARRRFEAIFEDPQLLVGLLATDGTLLDANQTAMSYVEAEAPSLRGQAFWETSWWSDEDRADVRRWVERAADGEYVTYDAELTDADGERYAVSGTIRPVTDAGDEVSSLVVSARDVTDREERERERESYERIIEGLGESTYVTDADGEFTYLNPAGARISGYEPEEIAEEGAALLYDDEEIDSFERGVRELLADDGADVVTVETTMQTKDGESVPVEATITAKRGEDGAFEGTIGVIKDVAERKATERQLREYESIIRALPDQVAILDTEGYITRIIPPTGSEVTTGGYDPAELEGKHSSEVMSEEALERGIEAVEELVTTDRERAAFEMEIVTRDGERLLREDNIALLENEDGNVVGTVGVLRDIEERKAYERELERQNERLEAFAGIASHDLRNPLNVARGNLDLLATECDSDYVGKVGEALDRMERLIDDTLAMARQGTAVAEWTDVDLSGLLPACWGAVDSDGGELEVADDLVVRGDEDRIRQVFENLFRNAVEHGSTSPRSSSAHGDAVEHGSTSPRSSSAHGDAVEHGSTSPPSQSREDAVQHGGEGVDVRVGAIDGDGIYVADDGPGIPPADRETVFEAGYSTAADGTGFGLAIVGEIVDAHGWEVAVTESENGGARFEITGMDVVT